MVRGLAPGRGTRRLGPLLKGQRLRFRLDLFPVAGAVVDAYGSLLHVQMVATCAALLVAAAIFF